ncbi:hypothetical protein [Ketogulonicigenium robustum]|nr:hypothetical protein [Ketogulonicigenium robustum]
MSEPTYSPPAPRTAGWGAIALLSIAVAVAVALLYTVVMPAQMTRPPAVEAAESITPTPPQP